MHLSDGEIESYAKRTLGPADLLAVDDHIAACDACRSRAAALAGLAESLTSLPSSLMPPESHLSDGQVGEFIAGSLGAQERASVEVHIRACPTCAREVEELGAWARKRPSTHRIAYAAAAAVLILLLIPAAMRWRSLSDAGQAERSALAGLEALPGEQQQRVRAALEAGVAQPPKYMADLGGGSDVLMGEPSGESFRLIEPLGTVTVSDRPTLRWEPLPGAEAYTVSLSDEVLRPVAESPSVSQTAWTPAQPLPRGRVYVWQVTAHRAERSVTAPAPPAPMARFRVLDEETARILDRLARERPNSHLLLGILYAQAGVRAEAENHLKKVRETDRYFETAKRTLERLGTLADHPFAAK
jgi:hypothetical protein